MGAGGKMDPTQIRVADLFDTFTCKLAFYVRKRLKKMDVGKGIKAVFFFRRIRQSIIDYDRWL